MAAITDSEMTEKNVCGNWKRDELHTILYDENLEILFEKVNGDTRMMKCTLCPSRIPPEAMATASRDESQAYNEHILAVWDLEKEAWRSFRVKSVIRVERSNGK